MTTFKPGDEVEVCLPPHADRRTEWVRATVAYTVRNGETLGVRYRANQVVQEVGARNVRTGSTVSLTEPRGPARYTISPYHVGHPTSE